MKYIKILSVFCILSFAFILGAYGCKDFSNTSSNDIMGDFAYDETDKITPDDKGETMKIKINETMFKVNLENNSTAKAFYDMLPQCLKMTDLNNNEKYCYINSILPVNVSQVKTIYAGDIMLWGNNCIVIFYETFNTNYTYSKIGKIVDIEKLKQCLGNGSVIVDFIK